VILKIVLFQTLNWAINFNLFYQLKTKRNKIFCNFRSFTFYKNKSHLFADLKIFFHESYSPKPLKIMPRSFPFFKKFDKIFTCQGAPLVSRTTAANLQPMSTTLVMAANFATGTAFVVDTSGKFGKFSNAVNNTNAL
jgi:hypothetical protein